VTAIFCVWRLEIAFADKEIAFAKQKLAVAMRDIPVLDRKKRSFFARNRGYRPQYSD